MKTHADVIVVGAGITGLAHAYACARRGLEVIVLERDPGCVGASVRNFGLVLSLGQADGPDLERVQRSARIWEELAGRAGFAAERAGLMVLARSFEEWCVLEEFVDGLGGSGHEATLHGKQTTLELTPAARPDGLLGGLWSPREVLVDPREAIPALAGWLEQEMGVRFSFDTIVREISLPRVDTDRTTFEAERVFLCANDGFRTLYPEAFDAAGLQRCKLQMLRTPVQPDGFRLGPVVLGGLSLVRYPAFRDLQSLGALRARIEEERPDALRYGIHIIAAQQSSGRVTLGDSHEIDQARSPFRDEHIDRMILELATELVYLPTAAVEERWFGYYPISPTGDTVVAEPADGVTMVCFGAGVGMSLAFAVAEDVVGGAAVGPDDLALPA